MAHTGTNRTTPPYSSKVLALALIDKYPEIKIGKWRVTVVEFMRTILPRRQWRLMERESRELLAGVPDAYLIDPGAPEVTIFEIEVYNPIYRRPQRVRDASDFFYQWDVGFSIQTIDAYGRISPLDPTAMFYGELLAA